MDRRSWLWRRKSSDKSSGETESLGSGSGSMSSPSERFSDEHQVYSIQNAQSPDVNLKHVEDTNDSVKILSMKLSDAVATIHEKEELVKQHAKVAEEAVTGWERAENEMNALTQQLDDATKKNAILEGKIVHLDGALKECLRQLRQVREEQDQKIQEDIVKKSEKSETENSALQSQLVDISAQLETVNALKTDLLLKLESLEKENTSLQVQIRSQSEALELRTLERDLCTKRAETASKQHLDGIKRVAKLEAECRMLKAMARKGTLVKDLKLPKDSRLDTGVVEPFKADTPSNTGFMDDFLEMEKLVSQPVQESRSSIERCNESGTDNALTQGERGGMVNRIAELEEMIEMVETEKVELGLTLAQCQDRLQLSESSFRQLEIQFDQCQNQLKLSQSQLKDANKKMGNLQAELDLANELRQAIDLELDDANVRREEAEIHCKTLENESKLLLEKERKMYIEVSEKCRYLEDELLRTRESKEAAEQDLRGINGKKAALESEHKAVKAELKSLLAKVGSLENEGKKEKHLLTELEEKCKKLESELSRTKHEADKWQNQLISVNRLNGAITQELKMVNAKKEEVELQLNRVQGEAKSLLARVSSLEHETDKERISSMEFAAKCKKLEEELSKMKSAGDMQFVPFSKEEWNKQQEKELAIAASKMAECQKTIASLGNQLKFLTTLDDIFSDSDLQLDISDNEPQLIRAC